MSTPDPTPPEPAPTLRARGRHVHRLGRGMMWVLNACLACATVLVIAVGALVLYFKDNPLRAPQWVQTRIEERLAEVLPQARVTFGEMDLVLDAGWRPRVRLRDVAVADVAGQPIARFNDMQAVFAARPLLEGEIMPREVMLSGIILSVRRNTDGSVALRATEGARAPQRQAATLPELIGQVDDVLLSPNLQGLMAVDIQALTLQYEDSRAERAWTVDGGRLRLAREGDTLTLGADLAVLSGGAGVATLSANYTSQIGETAATFGVQIEDLPAQDIASQGAAFAWLDVLRAPISGSVRSALDEEGRFLPIAATLQIGAGNVQPNASTTPIPFDGARSYFSYDPVARVLQFDELAVSSKWITGQAVGSATLGVDEDTGKLMDLVGQISLTNLAANPDGLYPQAVQIAGADADFRLTLDPFEVTLGRGQVTDAGQTLLVDGSISADPTGWRVAVNGQLDGIQPERLLELWPVKAVPNTRKWLVENLYEGVIRNVDAALRLTPGATPTTYLAFDYEDAHVRYSKTLPPVMNGRGHFTLTDGRLVVALDDGILTPPQGGTIGVSGSSFIIPDVRAKSETGTPAVVRLETRSSIVAALSLLNLPPLSVMDKANLPVALAQGDAALTGTLALSLKPRTKPRVTFHAQGELLALRSDVLVKDRQIAADRLAVAVDNSGLTLTGRGVIDDVPFDAVFSQPIGRDVGPSVLTGEVEVTAQALETFGVTLPPGSVTGTGRAGIEITLAKGTPPLLSLQSDLRGLAVAVPQVSWRKGVNETGRLRVAGWLGDVPQIETLEISGPGLSAAGSVRFNEDRSLNRIRFDRVAVGRWLDVPLDLIGRGAGRAVQVALRGGSLDLRSAEFGASQGGASPPMELTLDRLQITDTIALTNMRGRFATSGGLDGTFEALLNGEAPVEGRVLRQEGGRSAVRVLSGDAGRVLRAAGLLRQVRGGDLSLVLLPVGTGGAFDGRLNVAGVTIQDAPGIAALLNAVSVVGLVNELNGDGIYFDDVEASFRLTPNRLTLTEASAVGASMGLSMDGTYALDSGQLGMQGVISPVYLLNGIGSLFTRRGEGLIGFNYTLTGQARAPSVSVNPLSVFTPAMFREIFRAPPPELPVVEGVSESTLPQSRPQRQRPVVEVENNR